MTRDKLKQTLQLVAARPDLSPEEKQRLASEAVKAFRRLSLKQQESLKIFEPMQTQAKFLESTTNERIAIGGNRGGKTLVAAVEVARALTNQDPYHKFPQRGVCYVCVQSWELIGEVIWKKLFESGAFKVITDLKTGLQRAYRPYDPSDHDRASEATDAPPLIPRKYYSRKSISWVKQRQKQFKKIELTTGWEIHAFSTAPGTSPPRGTTVDLCWFDEEIASDIWYDEMASRLMDREGKFIWSASPELATPKYRELTSTAKRMISLPEAERKVEAFRITMLENAHLTVEAKEEVQRKITGKRRRTKIEGEFDTESILVYPEYDDVLFEADLGKLKEIPMSWTRYAAMDPGYSCTAVLFTATPPPDYPIWGGHVIAYDELYLENSTPDETAQAFREIVGWLEQQEFYIDAAYGQQHAYGTKVTIGDQVASAFERYGIFSIANGAGFTWSSRDARSARNQVHSWFRPLSTDGRPKFMVMKDRCPNFRREILDYRKKVNKGIMTEEPVKINDHLMDCLKYLAEGKCEYVHRRVNEEVDRLSKMREWFQSKKNAGADTRRFAPQT